MLSGTTPLQEGLLQGGGILGIPTIAAYFRRFTFHHGPGMNPESVQMDHAKRILASKFLFVADKDNRDDCFVDRPRQ